MLTVRLIVDIAMPAGLLLSGIDYEMPDEDAIALLHMGWAELITTTETTPEQHAAALIEPRRHVKGVTP